MCAHCGVQGVKLDGDKLVTVYSPASATTLDEQQWLMRAGWQRGANERRMSAKSINEANYVRTKADQ